DPVHGLDGHTPILVVQGCVDHTHPARPQAPHQTERPHPTRVTTGQGLHTGWQRRHRGSGVRGGGRGDHTEPFCLGGPGSIVRRRRPGPWLLGEDPSGVGHVHWSPWSGPHPLSEPPPASPPSYAIAAAPGRTPDQAV